MEITTDIITTERAQEILQGSGMHWILFSGDRFDHNLFEEWAGIRLDDNKLAEVELQVRLLEPHEALHIEWERTE